MLSNEELELAVYDKVCNIIKKNIDGTTVLSKDTTRYNLLMDSLDDVELLLWIEEEFDTDICDEDWEKCNTIADVVDIVLKNEPTIKTDTDRTIKPKPKKKCWWCGK
ncbi:acyl carrier protein-like protein [Vibrio phage vB_VpaM_R16F]|nr:acyl carrier protein-like protein [Vibrio phage vB_VpaM_R16F]